MPKRFFTGPQSGPVYDELVRALEDDAVVVTPPRLTGTTTASGTNTADRKGSDFRNPMTSPGDMIYGGKGGAPRRVPVGTVGQVPRLDVDGVTVVFSDAPAGSGYTDEMAQDAVGTILTDGAGINFTYTDATPAITAEPIFAGTGAAGTVARSDHAHTVTVAVNVMIDGGGSAITTGVKGFVSVPFAWTDIAKARLLADASCSAVVDVWKDTFANHPATDADSITAAAPLTLSTADSVEDSTLTGWTKTGSAGDILAFNVDSNNTALLLTVVLDLVRAL